MRTTKQVLKKPDTKIEEIKNEQNMLKVGYFQLQTKSFWLSLISILCLFLLGLIWTNILFYNKIIERFLLHEEKIIEILHVNYNILNASQK